MKKFLSKLVMVVLIVTLSIGISSVAYAYDDAEIISVNEQYLDSWNTTDFTQYLNDDTVDETNRARFTDWQTVKDQLGEFSAIDDTKVSEENGVITAVTTATYENSKLTFTITYDTETVESYGAMYGISDIQAAAAVATSSTPNMGKAALNTVMAMSIVFLVLILISFVISLLKHVPGLFDKKADKKAIENESKNAALPVAEEEKEEELVNDTELVAVIMAAISAFEENSVNVQNGGLVVRSIRRRK